MPKTKVLVIEDDRSLAEVLTYNLNVAGYEVLIATDGQDGLLKASEATEDQRIIRNLVGQLRQAPGAKVQQGAKTGQSAK